MSDLRKSAAALRGNLEARNTRKGPEERGRRLATLARPPSGELRISWDEYQGRPYLSLRLWNLDRNGSWWPDRDKGLTIRVHELPDAAEAVAAALDLAAASIKPGPGGAP